VRASLINDNWSSFQLLAVEAADAASASAFLGISTNPNPLDLPVVLSLIIVAHANYPKLSKARRKSSTVASSDKLPT
jgi:hypothetical protein